MNRPLPVIYIAGPYRAPTAWRVLANVRAAQEVALRVWKLGAVALCPHSNTGLFDGECEDVVWLEGDQELLRRCDAVLMMDRWRESKGSVAEYELAVEVGLPVFEMLQPLRRWIDEWKVTRVAE